MSELLNAAQERDGLLTMNAKGFGFVKIGEGFPDVFIPPAHTGGALQGEKVRVRFTLDESGRALGQIIAIDAPAAPVFVGRLGTVNGVHRVIQPLDPRWPARVRLPAGSPLPDDTLVQARLTTRPCGHVHAQAHIEASFGTALTTAVASAIVMGQKGLPTTFSAAALAEAEALPSQPTPEDMAGRWDVRAWPLVTIDGETSRDFDDAVYAEPHPEGFRLVVAIADVAHYVRPNTALDAAAIERTTSVYLPDRVLPMLPEKVSNGLCSLNPHEDRLCMVAELIVRPDGTVATARFANGVMRSAARLTYTHVAAHLDGESTLIPVEVHASLHTLAQVYQALARARAARGALEFDTPEVSFKEQEGAFVVVEGAPRNVAHKLIEECMIAANVAVAKHLLARVHVAPFRVHALHSVDRHDEFRAWSEPHGWTLPAFEHTQAADIKALLAHVGDHPLRPTLIAHIRRLQGEASYTPQNAGHFGLALKAYTHFTSPIRRYPDLLVHRALKEVLAGQAPSLSMEEVGEVTLLCVAGEKRAVSAERQVVEFQRAGYLATQVGHVFPGTVSNHAPMGVFVAFGPQASSMLGPAQLPGMTYDATTRTWRQPSGEPVLPVGQPIQVRLTTVDVDRARFQIEPVTPIA